MSDDVEDDSEAEIYELRDELYASKQKLLQAEQGQIHTEQKLLQATEGLRDANKKLFAMINWQEAKVTKPRTKDLVANAHKSFLRTQGRPYAGIGIPAYPALSDALFGFRGTTILTAPTAIGKTTLTLNIARSIAEASLYEIDVTKRVHVVYITTEMSGLDLTKRLLSDMTGTDKDNPCIYIRKLMTGDTALPNSQHEQGKLWLSAKQAVQYESAYQRLETMIGTTLHIVDKGDIGDMAWNAYVEGSHALIALQRKVDEICPAGTCEVLVILDSSDHVDLEPSLSTNYKGEQERQRYKDELSKDDDMCSALKKWRDHLGDTRALLFVHEESKARTGSGEMHSGRGSARYEYGQDGVLAMVFATNKAKNGSVDIEIREEVDSDTVFQVDLLVNKARDGGKANTTILLEHDIEKARISEWPRELLKPLTALVTAKERHAVKKPKKVED